MSNPVIPQPDGLKVVTSAARVMFAVPIGRGGSVVMSSDDRTVSLSLTESSVLSLDDAVAGWDIPGRLAVSVPLECGGRAVRDEIRTPGSPGELAKVAEAIPHFYTVLREPGERAALRAVYRRLTSS